jgi:hypothetical protein
MTMKGYGPRMKPPAPSEDLRHGTVADQPARRPIQIYSFDPMLANTLDRIGPATVSVGIPWEPLEPGPSGARIQVIDFDGGRIVDGKTSTCFYTPVNLDEPTIAVQGGLLPTEGDPRFHQQMVYAVAMRTLEAYDKALGRRLRVKGGRMRLFPHAFRGENAFYDPQLRAVLFGYFEASRDNPGPNLPGQLVFTSLSHDIISHEVTHGLIHRIRPLLLDGTNPDVGAFHEAIADLTALFLHFTLPGVVDETIAKTRTRLTSATPLGQLAQQFGYATGRGSALRGAIDVPDPHRYEHELEPHARGSILVAAVFDAFVTSYQRRIADLLRLATGGSGVLPRGAIHPDLVSRVSREAIRSADQVLTMCVRALDYLPPMDVDFSDFLRAIVTADRDLFPTDGGGLRTAFIDAFRRRGILPQGVMSLAEDALVWPPVQADWTLSSEVRSRMLAADALLLDPWTLRQDDLPTEGDTVYAAQRRQPEGEYSRREIAYRLKTELQPHADVLELSLSAPDFKILGCQSTFRYDEDGAPHVDFIVQISQHVDPADMPEIDSQLVEAALRRTTTAVFDESGRLRYVIAKPLPAADLPKDALERAQLRVRALDGWLDDRGSRDAGLTLGVAPQGSNRLRLDFSLLHRGLP